MLVAGSCFILPAFVMVLGLSWLYVEYEATPAVEGVLYGIQPVIIAIIVQAFVKLSGVALRTPLLWAVALVALVAYLLGVFELVLLAAGAVVVLAVRAARRGSGPGLAAAAFTLLPLAPVRASSPGDLVTLFLTFLKIGAILYGGGYVLLAFLRSDFVVRLGWLTEQQLIDGVAIGQVTPGPLFTTATFVGYVTNGWAGAVVATVAIFLPSFVFVGLLSRLVPWFRVHRWTADALDGINAAALALLAGVAWQLGQTAIVDPLTAAFAVIAGLLLWRTRWNSAWLILGGALAGLAHQVVTG
jgi:chromate transporter